MNRVLRCILVMGTLVGLGHFGRAAVTPVSWWRMGENDGTIAAGVASSTTDLFGGRTMTLVAAPFYDSGVSASAAARVDSTWCMLFFSGTYGTNALIPTLTNNFGIELWVNPSDTTGTKCLAYNGNTSTSGWGLYQVNAQYRGLFGGLTFVGAATATAGTWTHLALVRDNGTTTLYVNGVASGTATTTPNSPTGSFGTASNPQDPTQEHFAGYLDEIRAFTFAAGTFTTNDLLLVPHAKNCYWVKAAGGTYNTGANWLYALPPDVTDDAYFTNATSYQVDWNASDNIANAIFNATSGSVTQAIGASTWQLTNSCIVGRDAGAAPTVTLASGTLRATNAAGTGFYEVRRGLARLNGGILDVDWFRATNAAGAFEFNGGTLLCDHGVASNGAPFVVGANAAAAPAVLAPHGSGVAFNTGGLFILGSNAPGSQLYLTNGATLQAYGGAQVGLNSASSSNVATLSSASVWLMESPFYLGYAGPKNQLLLTSGGAVNCTTAYIGYTPTSKTNLVSASSGGVFDTSANLYLGYQGSGNQLLLTAGGVASITGDTVIGFDYIATNNQLVVNGVNSGWDMLGGLTVGNAGSNNSVLIQNSATVTIGDYVLVGNFAGSLTNYLSVAGGNLQVANQVEARYGRIQMDGGTITASSLLLANPSGYFNFNAGTLTTSGTTVNNSRPFTVGDGASAAAFVLNGNGVHTFANGLVVSSNATLQGSGTLGGTLTLSPGATLSPSNTLAAASPFGKLVCSNSPSLQGIVALDIGTNGVTVTNDQVQLLSGTLTYGGKLVVTKVNGTLAAGNRFQLFSAPAYAGAFSSVTLPALSGLLLWKNKLAVDGSIEVFTNAAPVLNSSISPALAPVSEDPGPPTGAVGTLVSNLVDFAVPAGQWDNVTDPDPGALLGIAITGYDAAHGTLYFSLNGGATWSPIGSVSAAGARLLAADSNNRLYFQPATDFNGTLPAALTFRAWDQTTGIDGGLADTTANGGTNAFSAATANASLTVTPVNDPPTASPPVLNGAYVEDSPFPLPTLVVADVDNTVLTVTLQIATNAVSSISTGTVAATTSTYNAATGLWSASGPIPDLNALLAAVIITPATNFCSSFGLTVSVSDSTTNITNTGTFTGTPVNDAPILDPSKSAVLNPVGENAGPPLGAVGTLVSNLVDFAGPWTNVTDVDTGGFARLGIAIVAANTNNGSWYYSTNGGTNWLGLGAVSVAGSRLLAADADNRVYFQPNPNYLGTIPDALNFRAWDRSAYNDGVVTDTTTNGGTTAFSIATENASLAVVIFTNLPVAGLPGLLSPFTAWGDYDNDGLLDFLITGNDATGVPHSQLWRNTGNGFTNVPIAGLPGLMHGSIAWGDYDNDGRLDLLLIGTTNNAASGAISQIWRNTGTGFSNVTASVAPGLPRVLVGSVAWADFDNDGRLDFLISGVDYTGTKAITQIWRNTGVGFTTVPVPNLPGLFYGSVAWADFDNDGLLDFLITGYDATGSPRSQLWRNTGNGFTNLTAILAPGLPQVYRSSVAWGDYDNDGRLDFLLTGETISGQISQLWRNTGTGFTNVPIPGLPGVHLSPGAVAWGDYDNDGLLDFLISGLQDFTQGSARTQLWRNTGIGFTNVPIPGVPALGSSVVAWGDFDNDGRLDFLFVADNGSNGFSQVWHNQLPVTNSPPAAPTGLALRATPGGALLSWNASPGLSYNVRAGSIPGGSDLLAGQVNLTNGFRRVPALGNALLRSSLPLTGLTNGQTIYWSVQAVNNSFTGGPFASETSFYSSIVTTTADSGAGSLRQAAAASPAASNLVGFAAPLSGQTITLTSGQITLSNLVAIDASSLPAGITVSGGHNSRVFQAAAGSTVVLDSLSIVDGDLIANGGGILNNGNLTLNSCTIARNAAGSHSSGNGGGISSQGGSLTLNQCTLFGNKAYASASGGNGNGGGISCSGGATVTINQCTLSGNSADNNGGGINNSASTLTLNNSIVAGNSGGDINGTFSGQNNLISGSPLLAALRNYGGPTQTMPPLPGSPAIDGCTSGTSFATDQRGFPRVLGAYADIGAVEGVFDPTIPLATATRLPDGQFQFAFTNLSGPSYTVYASTNAAAPFNTWSNLGAPAESPAGTFLFTDSQATNYSQRFYRMTSP